MDGIDVVHVGDDVVGVLAFRNIGKHARVLWTSESQLIVHQVPHSFRLRLVTSHNLLLIELTPGALAHDTAHL